MSTSKLTACLAVLLLVSAACERQPPPVPESPPLDPELPFSCDDVKLAWSYTFPEDSVTHSGFQYRGVTDAAGNLYWVECPSFQCALVSFTARGVERFRRPIDDMWPWIAGMMVSHGRVYVSDERGRPVALSDSTGEVLWRAGGAGFITEAGVDPDGNLWTIEGSKDDVNRLSVVSYFGATGTVRWSTPFSGRVDGLVLDAHGNAYALDGRGSSAGWPELVSMDRDGRVRGTHLFGFAAPIAELDGRLLMSDGTLLSISTGAVLVQGTTLFGSANLSPLISSRARFRWAVDLDAMRFPTDLVLEGYVGDEAAPSFRAPVGRYVDVESEQTSPLLLSNGNALLAVASTLRSIAPDGRDVFSCPLGEVGRMARPTALIDETWVAMTINGTTLKLLAFTTPGLKRAAHGWTGHRGNPGGTGRAAQ